MQYPKAPGIGLFLLLVVFIAGCATSTPDRYIPVVPVNGTPVTFGSADDGRGYALPRNTEFTVSLRETRADQSLWKASVSPGLTILEDRYIADPAAPRVDINGFHTWRLRAAENGPQTFRADYYQSGTTVQKTFSLSLQVLPESG
jgi:predicted secreted protein